MLAYTAKISINCVIRAELCEDMIMPEAFDPRVADIVAEAVKAHIN